MIVETKKEKISSLYTSETMLLPKDLNQFLHLPQMTILAVLKPERGGGFGDSNLALSPSFP